jgi:hypothetical protein
LKCEKCGFENDKGSNFCRQCGSSLVMPVDAAKDQTKFVAERQRDDSFLCFGEEEEFQGSGGMVIGIIFIAIAAIMALAMLGIFENIGETVGNFFGDFGYNMGMIGRDIGEFFSNWGTNFGQAVENFFGGVEWWKILQPLIVLFFFLMGAILLYKNWKRQQ